MTSSISANYLCTDNILSFCLINLKALRMSEMLKNLTILVCYCYFH